MDERSGTGEVISASSENIMSARYDIASSNVRGSISDSAFRAGICCDPTGQIAFLDTPICPRYKLWFRWRGDQVTARFTTNSARPYVLAAIHG